MDMEPTTTCFKIDKYNAKAMIVGYRRLGDYYPHHQAIWLDTKDRPFPMLISLQSTNRFRLSDEGRRLNADYFSIPFKYVVTLDSQYFVRNDMELWQKICSNGLFDIWKPTSPYRCWDEAKCDPSLFRILLLRVYEIEQEFHRDQVVRETNWVDRLTASDRSVTIKRPVVSDEEFASIKALLIESIDGFRQYRQGMP
jgi:hypothetical protein